MMNEIVYIEKFAPSIDGIFESLLTTTPWINKNNTPRDECFMATDLGLTYSYGNRPNERVYQASPMSFVVLSLMEKLNAEFKCEYNVCALNYYKTEREHLGWHADDSPEQDLNHPIAVVSFGATREIWIKEKSLKGNVPEQNKFSLAPGSLFVMPGGFQDKYFHKIPKCGHKCGGRISLTFRKIPPT